MIVKVHQTSFSHCGDYRDVDIKGEPNKESHVGPDAKLLWMKLLLEEVFYWGQNDHQEQDKPSVSMGDVAELWGRYWLCVSVGWKELSQDEWLNYLGMSLLDRQMYSMRLGSLDSLAAQAQELDMGY